MFWSPGGSPVRGDADMRHVCQNLFGDSSGRRRLMQIDSMIARLPGLEWFNLASAHCRETTPNQPLNHTRGLANALR
jgi:hypothetical protein